jgi:DNA-binding XRE family transcriptional regulator
MTFVPLTTYLRMYRKRSGLTHGEIAFLCGSMSGTSFTRHESAERLPMLRTALMYELIFRVPVRDIYEGAVEEVRLVVRTRAEALRASLGRKKQTRARDYKIAHLEGIIEDLTAGRQ